MDNPLGGVSISLDVFSGLDSELAATDLPMGLSPSCWDMAFLPGSTFTRPPQKRLFSLPTDAQIVYATTYLRPDGTEVQFVCDALGNMYANGTRIGGTAAGNRFKTVDSFGRLYIAISDGLHGADVPLQLDASLNLDRVSQDGCGGVATVTNYSIPAQALVTGASGTPVAITTAEPINPEQVQTGGGGGDDNYQPPQFETYYTSLLVTTGAPQGLSLGDVVNIAGNTLFGGAALYVSAIDSPTEFEVGAFTQDPTPGTGGTVTKDTPLLARNNGQVTASTAEPHQLKVGYQVTISGVADAVTAISSIAIDNDANPGIATVTTSVPHGFVPGNTVAILNVSEVEVGGGVSGYVVLNGLCTVTTNMPHGLSAGTTINLQLHTYAVRTEVVANVLSTTQFTAQTGDPDVTDTGGHVYVPWLVNSGTNFTIISIPSLNTFDIAITGPTFTWTSGQVNFPWNGTFFVSAVPSATSFSYAQSGPNATIQSGTGMVTPVGQIAPGQHTVWVAFLTRQGYLTKPGPSTTFNASGNQYAFVSNIPLGPSNVVARYLVFTGASGSQPFIIPVPYQNGTQVEGTSTVVNDNTTTSAILDFSDQALLASLAVGVPGNNIFRQEVMESSLGLFSYAGRLFGWGERNRIQQFYNMGFEGGTYAGSPNVPLGWTLAGAGSLSPSGDYGIQFVFGNGGVPGSITQNAYQDQYGVAILQPQTQYTFRAWAVGTVTAEIYSPTAGVLASATFTANGYGQADFSAKTPVSIPIDTQMRYSAVSGGTPIDEISIIYTANPYRRTARVSYINNPEAFDGVTGNIGPASDPHEIRAMFQRKDVLHMLTEGPQGSLYETQDSASGEPSAWSLQQIASQCGAISVWGDSKFEDWQVWASDTGLRIYNGGDVEKMSQEVQSWWNSFNAEAKQFTVVANDPYYRRVYILAAVNGAVTTNSCYPLDYRELNTAAAMANAGPYRISQSGKIFTSDLTRKWCPWSILANYAGLIRQNGASVMTFCSGRGTVLSDTAFGAVYSLDEGNLCGVDQDYGAFRSYYTTYMFVQPDEAEAYKLTMHRKQYLYMTMSIEGYGQIEVTPFVNALNNPWRTCLPRNLRQTSTFDTEIPQNVMGERVAFMVASLADSTTGFGGFSLNSFTIALKDQAFSPIRGSAY